MLTNMDKLYESVAANGPVCVGLDTEISYLPTTDTAKTAGENVVEFNRALIDATKGVAGCYKAEAGPRHRSARHRGHQARRHCQDRRNVRQGALYR